MTARHWTLSQMISLGFVAVIFAFGIFGGIASASGTLLSDATISDDTQ